MVWRTPGEGRSLGGRGLAPAEHPVGLTVTGDVLTPWDEPEALGHCCQGQIRARHLDQDLAGLGHLSSGHRAPVFATELIDQAMVEVVVNDHVVQVDLATKPTATPGLVQLLAQGIHQP